MDIAVINQKGQDTGKKITLDTSVFDVTPNDHAIYLDVKQYLANQRQGTHKSKERAEIAFSTKKIKKQKGTGGARAGSKKSPLFRKGGRVFGPRPRDYGFKLNKKVKEIARKSALTYKVKESSLAVVADFALDSSKTKGYVEFLSHLALTDKKTLFVIPEKNDNFYHIKVLIEKFWM
jgi:large subunit ribosomal protein L4